MRGLRHDGRGGDDVGGEEFIELGERVVDAPSRGVFAARDDDGVESYESNYRATGAVGEGPIL